MGFGRLAVHDFATETHPHPNHSTAPLASGLDICGTKLRFANSHKSPLEGEGASSMIAGKNYSIAELSLRRRRITGTLFVLDSPNESR
jgi:hypothetical protein